MKYWFMSYTFKYHDGSDRVMFGSTIANDGEHPITKIMRWNVEYSKQGTRQMALLSFQEITADEAEQFANYDVEV